MYVVVKLFEAARCGGWEGVGALQGCGKGKQAAAVTYINATPADVSNGFAFTPLCILGHTQ